jgi:hypothetical protein
MKSITRFLTILTVLVFVSSMNALASSKVSVVRELPVSSYPESSFTVTLYMDVNESNTPNAVGLTEYYPPGWTVSNISDRGADRNGSIEWLFWSGGQQVQDTNITYIVHVPASANDTLYDFNGSIDIGDHNPATIAGDNSLNILPYMITVARDLPSTAYTDSNITVYLYMDVSGERKPNAIGLVEFFPLGWTVSNISNGGVKRNTSIEWIFSSLTSPVQDTNISYVLSVPGDANASYYFTGQFNYSTPNANISDATIGDGSVNVTDKCALMGDTPPCGAVGIPEIVNVINQWAAGNLSLSDVIALINAWAHSS